LVAGLVALIFASPSAFAQSAHETKIDRGLEEWLRNGGPTQSVIKAITAGHRADIREALEKHGDQIRAEHPLVGALTVEIHSGDITEVANHPWVEAMSVHAGATPADQQNNHNRNNDTTGF
jgi:hypothetical protein